MAAKLGKHLVLAVAVAKTKHLEFGLAGYAVFITLSVCLSASPLDFISVCVRACVCVSLCVSVCVFSSRLKLLSYTAALEWLPLKCTWGKIVKIS